MSPENDSFPERVYTAVTQLLDQATEAVYSTLGLTSSYATPEGSLPNIGPERPYKGLDIVFMGKGNKGTQEVRAVNRGKSNNGLTAAEQTEYNGLKSRVTNKKIRVGKKDINRYHQLRRKISHAKKNSR
tara:strand:- start:66 stop:452 length:387 start_codon:yes stop_codon:yes gene_type:complete